MCFGNSNAQEDPSARTNAEIERQLRADQKRHAREVKLLLLGRPDYGWKYASSGLSDTRHNRSWREWQIDGAEADASHTLKRLLRI